MNKSKGGILLPVGAGIMLIFLLFFSSLLVQFDANSDLLAETSYNFDDYYELNTGNTLIVGNNRYLENLTDAHINSDIEGLDEEDLEEDIENYINETMKIRNKEWGVSIDKIDYSVKEGDSVGMSSLFDQNYYLTTREGPAEVIVSVDERKKIQ